MCDNLAAFFCIIIFGIPSFLLLSSPFHSLFLSLSISLSFTLSVSLSHRHTHTIKCAQMYIISLTSSLSLLLCLSLSIYPSIYCYILPCLPDRRSGYFTRNWSRNLLILSIFLLSLSLSMPLPFTLFSSLLLSVLFIFLYLTQFLPNFLSLRCLSLFCLKCTKIITKFIDRSYIHFWDKFYNYLYFKN